MDLEPTAEEDAEAKAASPPPRWPSPSLLGYEMCRSCLKCGPEVPSIFDECGDDGGGDDASRLLECTEVRVVADEGLPVGLCRECRAELRRAHSFRARCRRSDALLREQRVKKEEPNPIDYLAVEKTEPDGEEEEAGGDFEPENDDEEEEEYRERRKPPVKAKKKRGRRPNLDKKNKEEKYLCPHCAYTTRHRGDIVVHLRKHTGERPYQCEICSKTFTQSGSLAKHRISVHSDSPAYSCDACGRRFRHRDGLGNHVRLMHNKNPDYKRAEKQSFACPLCGKCLRTRHALGVHLDRHRGVKNFACEICGHRSVTKLELRCHMRVHGGDATDERRRFACAHCDKSYYVKRNLEIHMTRHEGVKRHECDVCHSRHYTKEELKNHRVVHDAARRKYKCPACDVLFLRKQDFNKHMKTKHSFAFNPPAVLVDADVIK